MKKRIISVALCLLMLASILPISAFALGTIKITKQPQNIVIRPGETATFSIETDCTSERLQFMWFDPDEVDVSALESIAKNYKSRSYVDFNTVSLIDKGKVASAMGISLLDINLLDLDATWTKVGGKLSKIYLGYGDTYSVTVTPEMNGHRLQCAAMTTTDDSPLVVDATNFLSTKINAYSLSDVVTITVDPNAPCQNHTYTTVEAKAATCTEDGWNEYQQCSVCGHNTKAENIIPALGHNFENGVCTVCGEKDPDFMVAPVVSITTSAGKPKLSWNAVDGAAKYWVYRSTDGKNFKYYDMTTSTTYTNKSTSIGTTYYYQVKAVKVVDGQNVVSDLSNIAKIMCAPSAPTVSISRSNGKPKLSWSAVSGATKYWIYRSTDGGKTYKYFDCTTKTSYTNSGAASGTTYYYKVKAVAVVDGNNVTSAYSSAKSLFTSLTTPTAKITTSNGKPKISWNAVTGVDKYYIYRSTDGKNFTFFDSTKNTSYTNTGAKKGTKYYYKVKAVCTSNSNANSAQSKAVSIKATK